MMAFTFGKESGIRIIPAFVALFILPECGGWPDVLRTDAGHRNSPSSMVPTTPKPTKAFTTMSPKGMSGGTILYNEESKKEDEVHLFGDGDEEYDPAFPCRDYDPNQRTFTYAQIQMFDLIAHPIYVFDYVERRMRWANKAGCEIWNATSLEELQQRSFRDTSASSERRMDGYMAKFAMGMTIKDQWTLYPNSKATTVHLDVSGVKFSEDDEPHFCLFCEATPVINEQVLQAESLRGVEMIRHLPMAVCQFDMEGKVIFQNPEAFIVQRNNDKDQAGESKEDDEGMDRSNRSTSSMVESVRTSSSTTCYSADSDLTRCFTQENLLQRFVDPAVGWQVLREIQSPMKNNLDIEAMIHTRNGAKWSAIQLRKNKDPVTGETVISYSAKDKSDAVKARKEREARERKSEFLAIMAHEIRTPLHQVTGFIDLLHETELNHEQKSYVRLLKSSAQCLMTVISDTLDYSKLEAGKMKLECIPYEPLSVVHGSLAAVRTSCEEKHLYLKLDWSKGIPYKLKGDPNRLRQILLNLLSNAVKFTKEGGITVKVHSVKEKSSNGASNSLIRFEVSDTGIGVREEHREMIFLKYQQANASVARNFGGTGLGLSICTLLAHKLGGSIGVKGHDSGQQGALFWLNLPADVAEELPNTDEVSESDDPAECLQGLHILVAEDNKINQKLMANMLKRMGHTSEMAPNGKEAINMMAPHKYDVVLMDIQMPIMDGLEATRRLRAMGYTNLPIYGLTASVARNDYAELGFDDWIGKPVPMKELKAKLNRLKSLKDREESESSPGPHAME